MQTRMIAFGNGFKMPEDEIMDMAGKIVKSMMSELPEEIQTCNLLLFRWSRQ